MTFHNSFTLIRATHHGFIGPIGGTSNWPVDVLNASKGRRELSCCLMLQVMQGCVYH